MSSGTCHAPWTSWPIITAITIDSSGTPWPCDPSMPSGTSWTMWAGWSFHSSWSAPTSRAIGTSWTFGTSWASRPSIAFWSISPLRASWAPQALGTFATPMAPFAFRTWWTSWTRNPSWNMPLWTPSSDSTLILPVQTDILSADDICRYYWQTYYLQIISADIAPGRAICIVRYDRRSSDLMDF